MDDTKADILMMFVLRGGKTMPGESTLQKAPGDEFMEGFNCVSDYDDYSNFFEVKNFQFSIKVDHGESGVAKLSKPGPGRAGPAPHPGAVPHAVSGAGAGAAAANGGSNDEWNRWRSAKEEQLKHIPYPVTFDTFSFTRIIDAASPIFFANCANHVKFERAVLVKRVSAGTGTQGPLANLIKQPDGVGGQSVGFLRIDFTGVMLTSLDWDDGDMVTEQVEMTCDRMEVKYKKQRYEGKLEAAPPPTVWARDIHGQPKSKPGS